MSNHKIWIRRGGDECVSAVCEALHQQHRGQADFLAFCEGPLEAGFVSTSDSGLEIPWNVSWQVRLFTPDWEFAARRLDFTAAGDWFLRCIASNPPGDGWNEEVELDDGTRRQLILTGQYICRGNDGQGQENDGWAFREERYSNATLNYPQPAAGAYSKDNYAQLCVRVHSRGDGDVVRWCGIERFVDSTGDK